MFPPELILYLPEIIGIVIIVSLVISSRSTEEKSKPLLAPMVLLGVWLIVQLLAQNSIDASWGLFFVRLSTVISCFMALSYYFAVQTYIGKPRKSYFDLLIVIIAGVAAILGMSDYSIQKVTANLTGISIDEASVWYYFLLAFTFGLFAYSLVKLYIHTRSLPKSLRARNYVLFISTCQIVILTALGSIFFAQVAAAQVLAFVSAFLFCAGIFFGIVRHKLFDVRLVVVRSLGYILSIATLALVYFASAYIVSLIFFQNNPTPGISTGPINIVLSLILAFAFQPIKRLFDKITNFLFYRDVYNVEEFFARLTKRLSIITDLNILLQYSSSEIRNTLKASFGAFYIYQIDKQSVYVSTDKRKKLPKEDARMLDTYVLGNRKEIVITEQLTLKDEIMLKKMLDSHRIALVLPITKDSIITGYLFLGEHLSSQYTTRDIRALLTIADELTIAIQNALSVQEIRELNESLQHRVDVATKELRSSNAMLRRLDKAKDDFISMASHQLRTPLTSIKGYISMVREGDVGKITPSQEQLLGEAFTSSERMVHLINDFLNVSRLQTGKFLIEKRPVNLSKVVEQELDSLDTNAHSRNLSFTYTPPKEFPSLSLDEDKMRQVIMNFADNAIYYSTEGTKIKVKLTLDKKDAIFTVTDTGIGVPRAEQSQLFNKFYRASNARKQRPDGTGVGLYLAKKVIDAHNGKVVFESVEGKGSTFGFRLPLKELRTADYTNNLKDKNNKS